MKTLQQCKDEVARTHGEANYSRCRLVGTDLMLKVLEEAAELYAQEATQSKWIDCNYQLPTIIDSDEKGDVLGWDRIGEEVHKASFLDVAKMRMRFTHWMPVPPKP